MAGHRAPAAGPTMRALKRRLSKVIYAHVIAGQTYREPAGHGWALGSDHGIPPGRLAPAHRHSGQATSRTHHPQAYDRPPNRLLTLKGCLLIGSSLWR
jgi:hypothetical protein